MNVVEIQDYSDGVLEALNTLMPQLSSSFDALNQRDLEAIVESDTSSLFMAMENKRYYGSLTLVRFKIPSGFRAWIEDVVVSEDARGKGVGEKLVKHAVQVANQSSVKSIDLTARSSRVAAISIYEKVGFQDRETTAYRYIGT